MNVRILFWIEINIGIHRRNLINFHSIATTGTNIQIATNIETDIKIEVLLYWMEYFVY